MYRLMKTSMAIGLLLIGYSAKAQPSDSEVKARVMRDGAKSVNFYGTGNIHNTLTETYYIRSFVAKYDTEYPGVTQVVSAEHKYTKNGGSWAFSREFIVEVLYDGIPNPTEAEIMDIILKDLPGTLGGAYSDIVNEPDYIRLAAEPKWLWEAVTATSFIIETSYDRKTSSTEVSKVTQEYRVKLYAEEFKGPWKNFYSSRNGYPKTISTQKFTAEEIRNMKTLSDLDLDREAATLMAALPQITIPAFKNKKEVIVHTFKLLRESTYDEFKAYMYQMMTDDFFHDNSRVLNQYGERLWEDMESCFDPKHPFKDQYCEHPTLKSNGASSVEFYNRAKRQYSRIAIDEVNGEFKISAISAGVQVLTDQVARVTGFGDANCGEPIVTEPVVKKTYSIGQNVQVNNGGRWHNGKIEKVDSYNPDRYFVRTTTMSSLWHESSKLRSGGSGTETSSTPTNQVTNNSTASNSTPAPTSGYAIGDAVEVKYKGAWHKGTIEKVDSHNSNRYFVRTTTTSSLWHDASIIRKDEGSAEKSDDAPADEKKEDVKKEEEKEKDKKKINAGGLKNKIKKIGG